MDLFKRIIKVFNNVNKDSGLKKSDIHKIVLIGGSYRIPKIQSLISEY
jgi:molecular chaperone DnaK (HSP70)